jgi:hypothetical protein
MKDVLIKDFELQIDNNGDFEIGNAENQSVEMLLLSGQGEWKEHPETGCDIISSKHGNIDRFLDRRIRVQLEADSFHIESLKITEKGLQLNGQYNTI